MSDPVIVLSGGAGRTFIESGLIAIGSSRERLFQKPEVRTEGSWMNSVTLHHEWVHFLQSITCASVHWASQVILARSKDVLTAASKGSIPSSTAKAFREAEAAVYAMGTDEMIRLHEVKEGVIMEPVRDRERIDMLDIMEGVAVLESFRLCTENAQPGHFLDFLDRHFPGKRNGVYRRAFDFLAAAIGVDAAFELLPGVSFIALQDVDVPGAFIRFTNILSGHGPGERIALRKQSLKTGPRGTPLDPQELTEYSALVEALELGDGRALPHGFVDGEPEAGHLCLDPCAALVVRELGVDTILQLAAFPHRATPETFEVLRSPLTVYSGEGRTIIEAHPGVDVEVQRNVIAATSMVGAAIRLVEHYEDPSYQFCPHKRTCPHYENALCHRQFAPPRDSRSHADCGFPKLIQFECGMDPSQLWAAVGHGSKTPQQLLEEFDATYETGLLELCRKQRGSITKWLGADGYRDIEWKCEATAEKALKAVRTQKIDDAIEARMFRDAVVRELHARAGG